jgi:hypothetical protein
VKLAEILAQKQKQTSKKAVRPVRGALGVTGLLT